MSSRDQDQDIARSSYADMLNDDERNMAYDNAITLAVSHLIESNKPIKDKYFQCCDIGTGSGLLSMMICRAFLDLNYHRFRIISFEAFAPMAECAKKVIESNGYSGYINVISKRSDEVAKKYNFDLLVAELLDTELIGEGCLETYRHALGNFCSPDCLFIPHEARIYIEPVASSKLFSRHAISGDYPGLNIQVSGDVMDCCGMPEIDDMQVGMLAENEDFTRISEPKEVFRFTFADLLSLKLNDYICVKFPINKEVSEPPVVVMWWDIVMFDPSRVEKDPHKYQDFEVLSCAPTWARSEAMLHRDKYVYMVNGRGVWREHWLQGIYYLSKVRQTRELVGNLQVGSELEIHAVHDSHSLWFDLGSCQKEEEEEEEKDEDEKDERQDEAKKKMLPPPSCGCGAHRNLSRSQVSLLNDSHFVSRLVESIASVHECEKSQIHGHLEFSGRGEKPNWRLSLKSSQEVADNFEVAIDDMSLGDEVPWRQLLNDYLRLSHLHEPLKNLTVKFTQVQFDDLHRIRSKEDMCEGFTLWHLDDLIEAASRRVDEHVEAHYLWEYSGRRIDPTDYVFFSTGDINAMTSMRYKSFRKKFKFSVRKDLIRSGWALVFWMELELCGQEDKPLSMGLLSGSDESLKWSRFTKQLVYFLEYMPISHKPGNDMLELSLEVGIKTDGRPAILELKCTN